MTVLSKRLLSAAVGVALWAATTQAAMAGVITWAFSYSGDGVTASGIVTTSDTPNLNFGANAFDVLAITGVRNGVAITGVVPPTSLTAPFTDFGFIYNNVIYSSAPFVDIYGPLYSDLDGFFYNVWFDGTTYWESYYDTSGLIETPLTEGSIRRVPEPTSLALIALSLLSLFAFGFLRQRSA